MVWNKDLLNFGKFFLFFPEIAIGWINLNSPLFDDFIYEIILYFLSKATFRWFTSFKLKQSVYNIIPWFLLLSKVLSTIVQ